MKTRTQIALTVFVALALSFALGTGYAHADEYEEDPMASTARVQTNLGSTGQGDDGSGESLGAKSNTTVKVSPWTLTDKGFVSLDGTTILAGAVSRGIDVSAWNNTINWEKVKGDGVDFAIIRAGFTYINSHKFSEDVQWKRNVEQCQKLGIPYGIYWYSCARNESEAKAEAAYLIGLLKTIKGTQPSLPVFYDLEDETNHNALSADTMAKVAKAWADQISSAGYTPGMYTMVSWFNSKLGAPIFDTWPRWVAHVQTTMCSYQGSYRWWQCAWDVKIAGIDGNVDLNFDYEDNMLSDARWVQKDGGWYRVKGNITLMGWQTIDNNTYYLNPNKNGRAETGLFTINGTTYAFQSSGILLGNAWAQIGNATYYTQSSGAISTGWKEVSGIWYYFDPNNGKMVEGWLTDKGKTYYLTPGTGAMVTGQQTIDGKSYSFDSSGALVKDSNQDSRITKAGWNKTSDGSWYWSDNGVTVFKGWKKVSGTWYYLDPTQDGKMRANEIFSDGKATYIARSSGACPANAWVKLGGKWYRTNGSCAVRTGWAKVNGTWYYLDPSANGRMKESEVFSDGKANYIATSSGACPANSWVKLGSTWYRTNGSCALRTGWAWINGRWYFFNRQTAAMQTGWLKDSDGSWYWLNQPNGDMATGWKKVNGTWYYLDASLGGRMLSNTTKTINGRASSFSDSGAWLGYV